MLTKKLKSIDFWDIITLVVFLLFALFLVYPLFRLLVLGFKDVDSGAFTFGNFRTFFERKYYTNAISNTLTIGVSVTLITVVVGTLLAYFLSAFQIKGKKILQ